MANHPANIWLLNENQFDDFTFTGGKVIYIVEEPDAKFATHPAIVTAGALLPPVEAIQAELDGNLFEANSMYEIYLQKEEADPYISIILAAALHQNPIGIMFGRDELNMQFPKMLIDFVYRFYGLVIGVSGSVQPCIMEEMLPLDLAKLYNMNIINYETFMTKHPALPIHPAVVSKMAYDIRPAVKVKDMQHYIEYFETVKNVICNNGGRFLIDPLEGI